MLKCSTSLWSADLANLAAEIKRVEPYSERFHLDVADGHYTPTLLFFPDLVKAVRPHTRRPLEIHLMTANPLDWIEPFVEAGADAVTFCLDSAREPGEVLRAIKARGKMAGVSLLVDEPVDLLEPYWEDLDIVIVVGTAMGIKGASMDPGIPDKIRRTRQIIARRGLKTEIEADGGIRRETVPLLHAAGADYIVPGSLMFREDPAAMRQWLETLQTMHCYSYDILGPGCTAIDDLLFVPAYPAADSKVQVRRQERHCGGLTATALVAAARLGSKCAFAGVLGDDELSRFVLQRLEQEGIDTAHVCRRPSARPVHSVIVVDEGQKTRTIFFDMEGAEIEEIDWPSDDLILQARVLFVDHIGVDRMIRAARVARGAGLPVVADLEGDAHPRFPQLLALVDHLILSQSFAWKLTGQADPAAAAERFWDDSRQAVAITCGREGCWYLDAGGARPRHQPAFAVEVVDTTGCGDVFHGAYASALARGLDLPARIRFAAAAAALKATQAGGQAGIPTRDVVEAFLERHG